MFLYEALGMFMAALSLSLHFLLAYLVNNFLELTQMAQVSISSDYSVRLLLFPRYRGPNTALYSPSRRVSNATLYGPYRRVFSAALYAPEYRVRSITLYGPYGSHQGDPAVNVLPVNALVAVLTIIYCY